MSTENLRDAIAALVHASAAEDNNHDCHHTDRWAGSTAAAILALPEMVAAMAVVEAAREYSAWRFTPAAGQAGHVLQGAFDAYEKVIKP